MRSVIYGTLFTVFLACTGTVQAANDLDGKALLCTDPNINSTNPVYGLVFDQGMVTRLEVDGYSKVTAYNKRPYRLVGTKQVRWGRDPYTHTLNRETLEIGNAQCSISSKKKIDQKLDEIIATGKKKNKI